MSRPTYPERSWFDPRLERRESRSHIHGTGVFANQCIQAGERLVIWGGIVYSSEDWRTGKVQLDGRNYNEGQIDEDLFLATPKEDLDYWFNHSCDPNFGGDVALRDIYAGEEVTVDYAFCIFETGYCLEPCNCGSPLCRRRITGNDWKILELQQRYHGHFPAFIERRIQGVR